MSQLCFGCNIGFVFDKRQKKYHRTKVLKISSPPTLKVCFPKAGPPQKDSFICDDCQSYLNERTFKYKRTGKRRIDPSKISSGPSKRTAPMLTPTKYPNPKKLAKLSPRSPTPPIPSLSSFSVEEKYDAPTPTPHCSTDSPEEITPKSEESTVKSIGTGPNEPIPSLSSFSVEEKYDAPTPTPHCSTDSPEEITTPKSPRPPLQGRTEESTVKSVGTNERTFKYERTGKRRINPSKISPEPSKRTASMLTPTKSPNPKKLAKLSTRSPTQPITAEITTPKSPRPPLQRRTEESTVKSLGTGLVARAKSYLANYEYLKAFKLFLKSPVKRHMITACSEAINKERRRLLDATGPLNVPVDIKEVSSFTWDSVMDWAGRKAPLLMGSLRATFPPWRNRSAKHASFSVRGRKVLPKKPLGKRKSKKQDASQSPRKEPQWLTREKGQAALVTQRTGMALAMALFTSSPAKANFIQKCVGIELVRQGCSQKVLKTLNHMGVSMGVDATRKAIDNMRLGHGEKMKEWKEKAEDLPLRRKPFRPETKNPCTYSVTWDNVQMFVHGKHQSKDHANQFLQFALSFAHQNKVDFSHITGQGCRAIEVQPSAILPTPEVFQRLRERMVVLVMRILRENLSALSKIKVQQHIPHAYTKEMNCQSNIANLGVVAANPSSDAGVIQIMRHLHDFVPVVDGEPLPILCCGDGLSVDRMISCKQMTNDGQTACQRLDGLIPTPQEFHKEMIFLQDSMDLLYKAESGCSRGTIAHMKNYFTHRSLKKNVSANVQHVWDMMEFATSAYITLLATTFCGMETVDDVPENLPSRKVDQVEWLESLANRIVDYAWMAPKQEEINLAAASAASDVEHSKDDLFLYCHCREESEEPMVQCCSSLCEIGWLHLTCAGLTEVPDKDSDYFCSERCEEDGTYMYCTCKQRKGGQMVRCQMKEECQRNEWYHTKCLLPADQVDAHDKWYCSNECAVAGAEDDFVQNYSKALLWDGLNHLARRDAVCEGDGPAMVDSWKLDLVQFWGKSHPKYFSIAHHMLTGIGGYLPANLQHDLTWNRVANVSGRPGESIGLDLVNEFLNNDFKQMLKRSHGRYTDKEVQKCAEMGGAFGKDLDKLLTNAGVVSLDDFSSRKASQRRTQVADIKTFVKEFKSDDLFSHVPGRYHEGLENFRYSKTIKTPMKMGKKMRMLAKDIDRWDVFTTLV